jgi:two-component system response regulator DesR
MTVVCELSGGGDVVGMAMSLQPDVAITDIDLFADEGFAMADKLAEAVPDCAVLVLACSDSPETLRTARKHHPRGLISKDTAPDQLVRYIRRVAAGEPIVIDPVLAAAALGTPRNPLTAREREILREAASGLPFSEIAEQLHLSVGTVRNYMSSVIRKTGGRNRWEAVNLAADAGWL